LSACKGDPRNWRGAPDVETVRRSNGDRIDYWIRFGKSFRIATGRIPLEVS